MALNRKTFKKAAAAVADTNLPSGYFNTVTYTGNGGTQRIGGYINRGGVFNGSSSYITAANILDTSSAFTYSLWINPTTISSLDFLIGHQQAASPYAGVSLLGSGSNKLFLSISGGTAQDMTPTLTLNSWSHIVLTHDGSGNYTCYTNDNGSPITYSGATSNNNSNPFRIGFSSVSGWGYLDGKVDQVRIFDKAISSSEVTTLYGETHASTTKSTTDIFNDNSGVALYQLDGNANDTGGVSGYIGEGAIFNGSSSSISLPAIGNSYPFSYSFWIYPNETDNNVIINDTISGARLVVTIGNFFSQTNNLMVAFGGANHLTTATNTITVGSWQHIAVIVNAQNDADVYINGSSVTVTNQGGTTGGAASYHIGSTSGTSEFFDGKIDQVRIYDKALSSSEVTTLYGETASSNITISDLVAYYPMEGTSLDQEGSYHGTDSNVEYNYNGTATNVTYQEATNFSPDLVWIKNRFDVNNVALFDSIRGREMLTTSTTNQGFTPPSGYDFTSFDSNGFTVAGTPYYININDLNDSMVAWCFNAGTDAAASNTDGSIDSTVKANTDSGFSIVEYTGNLTASTVGTGLSSPAELIIVKRTDSLSNWFVYSQPTGNTKYLNLDTTGAAATFNVWNNTSPTSSVFSLAAQGDVNASGGSYIAYCFHSVDEIQKVGSYTGTGAAGNIVETGFEPAFVIIKRTDVADNWIIFDNERITALFPNSSSQELSGYNNFIKFASNGFIVNTTDNSLNNSSGTYIYLAIAADPDTTTPTVEDSFEVVTYTGNGSTQSIDTGFKPDFVWIKNRTGSADHHSFIDSVRGTDSQIFSNLTNAENTFTDQLTSFDSNGFTIQGFTGAEQGRLVNVSGTDYVAWCWKAGDHDDNLPQINTEGTIDSTVSVNDAAGFSIVKYTGNGNNSATVGHGLSSAPEMIIVKDTSAGNHWAVVHTSCTITGTTTIVDPEYKMLRLDSTDAEYDYQNLVVSPGQSSTTFTLGNQVNVNGLNNTYIAYCFTSITGYQKVGSYSGTGSAGQTITTGFQPRFVMIKATNNASDWYLIDSVRPNNKFLIANGSNSEFTASDTHTFTSTGFTLSGSSYNNSGYDWIYLAIA